VVVKALADVREKIPTYAACLADNPSEVLGRFRAFVG